MKLIPIKKMLQSCNFQPEEARGKEFEFIKTAMIFD